MAAAQLCQALGIDRLAAIVGISAGGRTALMVTARHPHLVERVILQSAVAFLPWPGRLTRLGGRVAFHARIEAGTWALLRSLIRRAPSAGPRLQLRDLVRARLSADRRQDAPLPHHGLTVRFRYAEHSEGG
ncbi:alpha/beta fold hydrolase [Nonomuraea angiospora]|uniref:alpha/beta fold hydrolase n=1 Tax=Nonomuraea angiospora TaxID=46172 RepID=UPI0033F40F3A